MKRFLALLLAMFPGLAKADTAKLGSETDPIRQRLYACQSMKELLDGLTLDGSPGPFQTISDAATLVSEGKKEDAIARLRGILLEEDIETRIELWVWRCLRDLGEQPDQKAAGEVLGAVIEVPTGGGCDTLAAYADGSARYLNFSGTAIFWDKKDAEIKSLCQMFIDSTISISDRAISRKSLSLPVRHPQVTILTRSGIYAISQPPQSVIDPAAALMMELMTRAKEKKG